MKVQVCRFSPHQNAKVLSLLMAAGSLIFVLPMFIALSLVPPGVDAQGDALETPPAFVALLIPFMYLVLGYIMVVLGCALYNFISRYVGGIEYEVRDR